MMLVDDHYTISFKGFELMIDMLHTFYVGNIHKFANVPDSFLVGLIGMPKWKTDLRYL